MRSLHALCALAAVLPAGCMVGPEYKPPEPLPGAPPDKPFETAVSTTAGFVPGPVTPDWWNTLGDPKLTDLVRRSVADSLDLKTADSRVREARAARGLAAADLGPQVSFGSAAGPGAPGPGVAGNYAVRTENWKAFGFDASWEIDVFGGNRRAVQAAGAEAEAAMEARRDVLVSLLGEVGRNYVELRGAQRRLEIARRNIEIAAKTLDFVRTRRETGLGTELEVRQAGGQLESVRATLPPLEAAVRKAIFRLGVLQAKEPAGLLGELSEPAPIPEAPPEIPTGLPSELLRRRPDVRRAERELAAATARLGAAVADKFPRFALTGNVTLGGFYVGPAVKWPVFDSGRIASNIAVSDERLEQATLRYRAVVLTALEDVENALTAYAQEQIRRGNLANAVAEARRAVALAEQQHKDGLRDFLVVLDAQRTFYALQDQLVLSEQSLLVNLVSLYKALGGGWDQFAGPADKPLPSPLLPPPLVPTPPARP